MASRFVSVDRHTPLLLPPDLREWVRADDLVHFILDAVEVLPLQQFQVNGRGSGSEQYPPKMMLALLIYSYATGTFSSRAMEQLTYHHVSVRYLCANTHPDHDTINEFRRNNKALLEETFVKVLELAHEMKLAKVGTVAIDGTKVAANASKHAAVSYGRAGEIITRLEEEVQALLEKAEAADSVPLQDGLSIPAEIALREARKERLQAARAAIEARVLAETQAQQAEYEAKVAERQARRERGESVRGREPQAPAGEPEARAQYNFTDPESRIMKAGNGQHFEQAYNAQAAVTVDSMLIVGQQVSDAPNDKEQLQPTVQSIPASVGTPDKVLVDAGYFNTAQIAAVEQSAEQSGDKPGEMPAGSHEAAQCAQEDDSGDDGPGGAGSGRVATLVYASVGRLLHDRPLVDYEAHPAGVPPAPQEPLKEQMRYRLGTVEGKAAYKLRKHTVEPVFGIIKHVLGFRRFSLRGQEKVSLEWTLVCLAWNLKRLHTLGMAVKMEVVA